MFTLKLGDIARVHRQVVDTAKSKGIAEVPNAETVRRFLNGDRKVRHDYAEQIIAAYTKLKPARSRRQASRNASTGRRSEAVKGRKVAGAGK